MKGDFVERGQVDQDGDTSHHTHAEKTRIIVLDDLNAEEKAAMTQCGAMYMVQGLVTATLAMAGGGFVFRRATRIPLPQRRLMSFFLLPLVGVVSFDMGGRASQKRCFNNILQLKDSILAEEMKKNRGENIIFKARAQLTPEEEHAVISRPVNHYTPDPEPSFQPDGGQDYFPSQTSYDRPNDDIVDASQVSPDSYSDIDYSQEGPPLLEDNYASEEDSSPVMDSPPSSREWHDNDDGDRYAATAHSSSWPESLNRTRRGVFGSDSDMDTDVSRGEVPSWGQGNRSGQQGPWNGHGRSADRDSSDANDETRTVSYADLRAKHRATFGGKRTGDGMADDDPDMPIPRRD